MKLVSTLTGQSESEDNLVYNSVLNAYVYPEDSKDFYSDDELSDIEMFVELDSTVPLQEAYEPYPYDDEDYDPYDEEIIHDDDESDRGALLRHADYLAETELEDLTPYYALENIFRLIEAALKKRGKNFNLSGTYFYCNGNDGTDFDWEANDRICETRVENDAIDFEFFVYTDGELGGYIWKHETNDVLFNINDLQIKLDEADVFELAAELQAAYDNQDIYNPEVFKV